MEDVMAITERESGDTFIEISVEDPQKIGDGMHSYLAYK
jgi:sorting nexin-1/2